jgi:hypothetical protein
VRLYRVTYYKEGPGLNHTTSVTVAAHSAQAARDAAKELDPKYIACAKPPRIVYDHDSAYREVTQ